MSVCVQFAIATIYGMSVSKQTEPKLVCVQFGMHIQRCVTIAHISISNHDPVYDVFMSLGSHHHCWWRTFCACWGDVVYSIFLHRFCSRPVPTTTIYILANWIALHYYHNKNVLLSLFSLNLVFILCVTKFFVQIYHRVLSNQTEYGRFFSSRKLLPLVLIRKKTFSVGFYYRLI